MPGSRLRTKGRRWKHWPRFEARASAQRLAVYSGMDPRSVLALALKEMGENARKIGALNITTETLGSLLGAE